ncbi:M14 family metallopeptidase [Paraburkholderia kururiensis]|uniref:M14 family metallopeptidase n=1 Tax=Paraburkholderia kururiensis TaxID=984307 RepID=UPI0005A8F1AA|nr:M14 family metallopeptidase [Paraburkholderia kururiensis]
MTTHANDTHTHAIAEAYPVDVEFPVLAPYAAGNTGVPYVYTFDSGAAGPHVMINALTHGNEVCGAITVKALLDAGVRPRKGRLTLAFANVDAYLTFDRRRPDASRFVDQDFNRVWSAAKLNDPSADSTELRRARAMQPVIDTVDMLLDLHSMHEKSAPLALSGPLGKGIALARQLGAPATVISDEGHPEGRRMRDYADFSNPQSPRNALLVECGQHWEPSAVTVAKDCTARFLALTGVLEESALPEGWFAPKPEAVRVIRVTEPVVAKSMDFRFAGNYTGLETFEKAGTVIAWNGGEPVVTPYDNCVLVMPSLRQLRPGVTVVRLGKIVA